MKRLLGVLIGRPELIQIRNVSGENVEVEEEVLAFLRFK